MRKFRPFLVGTGLLALIALAFACGSGDTTGTTPNNDSNSGSNLNIGVAPDFELPSFDGSNIRLSDYRGEQPVVLVFYRTYFCTFCRRQIGELNENYDEFKARNTEVIAISSDRLDERTLKAVEGSAQFPLLYTSLDPEVPQAYDRYGKVPDGGYLGSAELADPGIFLISPDGDIVWRDLGTNISHFVDSDEILDQIDNLLSTTTTEADSQVEQVVGGPQIGDPAPDFTLPSVEGGDISLSDYRGDSSVLLVFYRSYFCAFCKQQLNEINLNYDQFNERDIQILAISSDMFNALTTRLVRDSLESGSIQFPLLYTSALTEVAMTYGRIGYVSDIPGAYNWIVGTANDLIDPGIFLLDSEGTVVWRDLGTSTDHFVSAETILEVIDSELSEL